MPWHAVSQQPQNLHLAPASKLAKCTPRGLKVTTALLSEVSSFRSALALAQNSAHVVPQHGTDLCDNVLHITQLFGENLHHSLLGDCSPDP
eukprot:6300004-Amphidinium_carterae.1